MASPVRRPGSGEGMDAPPPTGTGDDSPEPTRDWSELPLDALASVFVKLGAIEILMGAGLVCRSWLHAAKLPDLWRSVDMARHKVVDNIVDIFGASPVDPKINRVVLRAMARFAVDRSRGQLEVFVAKRFVTDQLLEYIGDRSPALKAVGLVSCAGVSNEGFTQLVARCPLLEDLMLVLCPRIGGRDVYEATGRACPQLRRFRLRTREFCFAADRYSDGEALGVAAMHGLRTLALYGSDVTNDELAAVLDGCPHLESLDLSEYFNIVADDALRARCAGIKSLVLPLRREVDDEYEYETLCSRDVDFGGDSD
ncbi:putative F-box/LRR-repeat protein 9 [Panicum virgatum]|uniref:putative F-box/LRR-repeat protein 9 n=1 Tax=Panicum virgatum TaxID=38727 RepID=UPI0019D5E5C8|nr:putative F-box/LRR-repeat protein 9 [Panicum virgatum]